MKILHIIISIISITFISCSDDVKILEKRIEIQAEKNNTDISSFEVTKTALSLLAWGKEDFYQEAIDEFLDEDMSNFPEEINVLFTGSSSIRFWETLEEDMYPLKVLNRGFGGAHIAHVNYHFKDVVERYNPKAIVFFCGTNDITALKTPDETVNDFKVFRQKVKAAMPDVHIFVIGIKPTPARQYLESEEMEYNRLITNMSKKDDLLTFIDIWEAMLTEDGSRVPQLFVDDGLHINAEGYKIWTKLVRSHLKSVFSL